MILVGLPGAGKTTAGRLAARALRTAFVDVDAEIERAERASIPELFRTRGEAVFRRLERRAVERVLAGPPCVVAPGGGWAAEPGNLPAVRGRSLVVYLATTPAVAAARLGGGPERPVLAGGAPEDRLRALLARRKPYYREADAEIATDQCSAAQVASQVVLLARSRAGW